MCSVVQELVFPGVLQARLTVACIVWQPDLTLCRALGAQNVLHCIKKYVIVFQGGAVKRTPYTSTSGCSDNTSSHCCAQVGVRDDAKCEADLFVQEVDGGRVRDE